MITMKRARFSLCIVALLFTHSMLSVAQTFKSPGVSYSADGYITMSVTVADLNGDGQPDLLVANFCADDLCTGNGRVGVLLGNKDGTFQPAVTYDSGGFAAYSVAVADVNGDGKPDLIVSNACEGVESCGVQDATIGVLLGNGNGTFQPVVSYNSGGGGAYSVVVADLNGDGKPDLAVANLLCHGSSCKGDGLVGVLLGNGDGTFEPVVTYDSGGPASQWIVAADVNADGRPDLLVSNTCGSVGCHPSVGVLLNNGDGTFQPAIAYAMTGWQAEGIAVVDINGDGKPDLVAVNQCVINVNCGFGTPGAIDVMLGNGNGTFQSPVIYDTGGQIASSVVAADVNGDGKLDLIVSNNCDLTCSSSHSVTLGVLLGNGDGTFLPAVSYHSGGFQGDASRNVVALADFNGDGRLDAVVSNGCKVSSNCKAGGAVEVMLGVAQKTTTQLATSGSPSFIGQRVTFTATITPTDGPVSDGTTVTFFDGSAAIGTGPTVSGTATFTASSLSAKTHTIKASYPGNLFFSSSSATVKQVVNKYSTTTALKSSPKPSHAGQSVTFTATVASPGPKATGRVTFLDGTTVLGSATLSSGIARLSKSTLAVGTHSITAEYAGDANSLKSTSSTLTQVVQ
jgi:large repetitive protein